LLSAVAFPVSVRLSLPSPSRDANGWVSLLRRVGNKVYEYAFPIYRVCYCAFKAYTDRADRRLLRTVLSVGAVVVDAGANIGVYSQFLSRCVRRL
jgi:hypothetical protein